MIIAELTKQFSNNSFVKLHDDKWLSRLRIAGKCVSSVMEQLETLVKENSTLSLIEINNFAESEILKQNCTPTFKGYKGFPAAICMSVNKQLVHGIPTDYKLQNGDVISFDFGATFEGAIADSARTYIFGEGSKENISIIKATNECLLAGIAAISVEKKLGCIGNAIFKTARSLGFNVISHYGGHGISYNTPHDSPFVSNKANEADGIIIQEGLTIAIEPMLVPYRCPATTKTGKDGWTIYTEEIGSHSEDTIFIHQNYVENITRRKNEN